MDAIGPRWKRKTRKALRHAGFCIALVIIGPVFGGLAYYESASHYLDFVMKTALAIIFRVAINVAKKIRAKWNSTWHPMT